MKIRLNRNRKVELLKALQAGELDLIIVCRWFAETISTMEDADLEPELGGIKRAFNTDTRKRIKEMAVCDGCVKWLIDNGRCDLSRLTNEELTEFSYLVKKCNPKATPEEIKNAKIIANDYKGDTRYTK